MRSSARNSLRKKVAPLGDSLRSPRPGVDQTM